jgi:hypothetical protein
MKIVLLLFPTILLVANAPCLSQVPGAAAGSRQAHQAMSQAQTEAMIEAAARRARMSPAQREAADKKIAEEQEKRDLAEACKIATATCRKWTIDAKRMHKAGTKDGKPLLKPVTNLTMVEKLETTLEGGRDIAATPVLLSTRYVWLEPKNEKDGKDLIKVELVNLTKEQIRILSIEEKRLKHKKEEQAVKEKYQNKKKDR